MSNQKEDENWLELERDVHRLHVLLNPGKEVIHEHIVPDRDGGFPRQVDIVANDTLNLTFSLDEALECRCYKRPQGTSWVEQAQGGIRSLKAGKLALVSNSGWYKPAQVKADALNAEGIPIEIRVCEDVTDPDAGRFHPEPTLNNNALFFELVYKPEGACQVRMSSVDRRCDFGFRTVEWITLAAVRQPKTRRAKRSAALVNRVSGIPQPVVDG